MKAAIANDKCLVPEQRSTTVEKTAAHLIQVEIKTNHFLVFRRLTEQDCILKRIEPRIVP
jgi:hypothetical protein